MTMGHIDWAMAMIAMARESADLNVCYINCKCSVCAMNRNRIVHEARALKSDYLLFVDTDLQFPPDALRRLLTIAVEKEAAIVGCAYLRRSWPFPVLAVGLGNGKADAQARGVVEVARLPTGLMMIDLAIFDRLKKPYFAYPLAEDLPDGIVSEDYPFCDNVREVGGHIYLDTDLSLEVKHWGQMAVQWHDDEKGYRTIVGG